MPLVTGVWASLSQADFESPHPVSDFQHFRTYYRDVAQTQPITLIDPFTGVDTGQPARQVIEAQAASFGWPLIGLYVSASGGIPHFALHRSQFPAQTGNPQQRAEKLQTDLNAAMERIYKSSLFIDDPTDPQFGQTVDVRNFWVVGHVWNYRNDGLYLPRDRQVGTGDFDLLVSDLNPPANWWQQ